MGGCNGPIKTSLSNHDGLSSATRRPAAFQASKLKTPGGRPSSNSLDVCKGGFYAVQKPMQLSHNFHRRFSMSCKRSGEPSREAHHHVARKLTGKELTPLPPLPDNFHCHFSISCRRPSAALEEMHNDGKIDTRRRACTAKGHVLFKKCTTMTRLLHRDGNLVEKAMGGYIVCRNTRHFSW